MKQKKNYKVQFTVDEEDKELVEGMVQDAGFASLPAAMKFVFTQLKKGQVDFKVERTKKPVIYLTNEQSASLARDVERFEKLESEGKVYTAKDVDEFIDQLENEGN